MLLESDMHLLHHIADAAGYLPGAGIEQAEIVGVGAFRAHSRIAVAKSDATIRREVPTRRRRCPPKPLTPAVPVPQVAPVPSTRATLVAAATTTWIEQM